MQSSSQQSFLVLESEKTKEGETVDGEYSGLSLRPHAHLARTLRVHRQHPHLLLSKGEPFTLDYHRPAPHLRRTGTSTENMTIHGPPSSTGRKNNIFVRPVPMARSAIVARANDWSHWVEVAVQFSGFPVNTTTRDIWNVFKNEGDILTIELFDDYNGNSSGRGRIRFW